MTEQYGFYGRLRAEFPSQIIVDTTEVCNLACIHCPHETLKQKNIYKGSFLDPALNKKLVDEVKSYGKSYTQYIRYTGNGEPLLHQNIFEMLKYAVDNSGVAITLTTNGTLLKQEKIENLLDTGVDIIDISIDAFSPETYAKIRVNGNLNITRYNVLNLIRSAKKNGSKTKVVVSYVEQKLNKNETFDFEKFWKSNGAEYVIIRRFHTNAGLLPDIVDASAETVRRYPCLYPWERLTLHPSGRLLYCPIDWNMYSHIGDYRDTTIKEIWQGDSYRELRKAHLDNNYENIKCCKPCPDWIQTRWPDEGRSYADMVQDFKNKE